MIVRQNNLTYGWDLLPHPPYSADITPSNFHLFMFVQNSLSGMEFNSLDAIKRRLDEFFLKKSRIL